MFGNGILTFQNMKMKSAQILRIGKIAISQVCCLKEFHKMNEFIAEQINHFFTLAIGQLTWRMIKHVQ